uniref:Uncharacterized protein n=1 Tax=Anguilla anguilla TaxID=7936 RepID=A0A0E9P5B6_ANGAN
MLALFRHKDTGRYHGPEEKSLK